jgi:hypothetical protein
LRLGEAVEEVCGDEATGGDVEAALYSGNHKLAIRIRGIGGLLGLGFWSLQVRVGGELTPKPSFTGSAWAWDEPKRRGAWVRSTCRVEAAQLLATNMAVGDN